MTTSFENLTSQKLTLISKNINLDIDPKEILDIDTSTFIEGTLLFTIKNKNQISIWKGYVPIKNSESIKIFGNKNFFLKINDTVIPNILESMRLENYQNEKENFLNKNKFKIILFIIILLILFFFQKYLKQK